MPPERIGFPVPMDPFPVLVTFVTGYHYAGLNGRCATNGFQDVGSTLCIDVKGFTRESIRFRYQRLGCKMEHHVRTGCRKNCLDFIVLTNIAGMMGNNGFKSADTIIIPGCFWIQSYTGDRGTKLVKPEGKPGSFKPGVPCDE